MYLYSFYVADRLILSTHYDNIICLLSIVEKLEIVGEGGYKNVCSSRKIDQNQIVICNRFSFHKSRRLDFRIWNFWDTH